MQKVRKKRVLHNIDTKIAPDTKIAHLLMLVSSSVLSPVTPTRNNLDLLGMP